MLLKLIGSCILAAVAFGLSRHLTRLLLLRIRQLEGFLQLLRTTREKIVGFGTPTPEIFAGFRNEALEAAGFLPALREGSMRTALREARDGLYLDDEELLPLLEFAASLGSGFADEEAARCEVAIAAIERALEARRSDQPNTAKLGRTLVVGASLAVILVLV